MSGPRAKNISDVELPHLTSHFLQRSLPDWLPFDEIIVHLVLAHPTSVFTVVVTLPFPNFWFVVLHNVVVKDFRVLVYPEILNPAHFNASPYAAWSTASAMVDVLFKISPGLLEIYSPVKEFTFIVVDRGPNVVSGSLQDQFTAQK